MLKIFSSIKNSKKKQGLDDKKVDSTKFDIEEKYKNIFDNCNGYSVSSQAKDRHENQEIVKNILYGEANFEIIKKIFCHEAIKKYVEKASIFYDLGSGIGNVVIGNGFLGLFNKCVGIELLKGLYDKSLEFKSKLPIDVSKKIEFINDSFLKYDFSDADVIYANHPTKDEEIQNQLEEKLQNLKENAIVIFVIHSMRNMANFEILHSEKMEFSWGGGTVRFYRKIR